VTISEHINAAQVHIRWIFRQDCWDPPLDDIHVKEWPIEWVREFNELLTALRRVSDLEPDQADLLGRILDGPTVSRAELVAEGVRFPASARDRRPRYGLEPVSGEQGMLSDPDE